MAADPNVLKRLAALEARVKACELRLGETKALAELDGVVIDIKGEWALRRIIDIMVLLAPLHANNPGDSAEIRQEASEAIEHLQSLGFMAR